MMHEWKEVPCECGFTHEENKEKFEVYYMRMGSCLGQELPKREVVRCKTCKQISTVTRE